MPRPKQRTPELRERVLDVATELLAQDGVDAFTTRRIAQAAGTSLPAVYELFGDKTGLVREIFFRGFEQLRAEFDALGETDDPLADLLRMADAYKQFVRANPVLAQVMFSRPFATFDPGPEELVAGAFMRRLILTRVRRCIDTGLFHGHDGDLAHALMALVQGLASAESAQILGSSEASIDRRWTVAVNALVAGFGAEARKA
jgi:AcrR family transcriptional regulator